jgi:hypothetical protein
MARSPWISNTLAIALLALFSSVLCFAHDENGVRFEANGVSIYYEVSGSGSGVPLVVANGGPGFDHTYLHLPFYEEPEGFVREVEQFLSAR